jgi:signal peptidase I
LKKLFKSKAFWENVSIVLIAVLLFIGLRLTIQSSVVRGPSMENTFQNGEKVLVDKVAYKFSAPQRGLGVSLCSFFQNRIIQREVSDQPF